MVTEPEEGAKQDTKKTKSKKPHSLVFALVLLVLLGVSAWLFFALDAPSKIGEMVAPEKKTYIQVESLVSGEPRPLHNGEDPSVFLGNLALDEESPILYWRDDYLNCNLDLAANKDTTVAACFDAEFPDSIFIYWGDDTDDEQIQFALLHEYAHFYQYHQGIYTNVDMDVLEMDANCWAAYLGAVPVGDTDICEIPNWYPGYMSTIVPADI
jgi:hypothetical protein